MYARARTAKVNIFFQKTNKFFINSDLCSLVLAPARWSSCGFFTKNCGENWAFCC